MSKAEGVQSLQDQLSQHFGRAKAVPGVEAEDTADELDTEKGIPSEATDLEADEAETTTDEDDSDIDDDDTPDDDESEESGFEQRFKDTQAKLTETSQSLAKLREEYSQNVGQITEARLDLEERLSDVEAEISFWESMTMQELQQLHSVNVQQLSQEDYLRWQQMMNSANARAQGISARKEQFFQHAKAARENAVSREVKVARSVLTNAIENFDDVYPEIGEFAVENGVSPKVFRDITDPGLIKLLYKAMTDSRQGDTVKEVARKTQTNKQPPKISGRANRQRPKSLAERMYGST